MVKLSISELSEIQTWGEMLNEKDQETIDDEWVSDLIKDVCRKDIKARNKIIRKLHKLEVSHDRAGNKSRNI